MRSNRAKVVQSDFNDEPKNIFKTLEDLICKNALFLRNAPPEVWNAAHTSFLYKFLLNFSARGGEYFALYFENTFIPVV